MKGVLWLAAPSCALCSATVPADMRVTWLLTHDGVQIMNHAHEAMCTVQSRASTALLQPAPVKGVFWLDGSLSFPVHCTLPLLLQTCM